MLIVFSEGHGANDVEIGFQSDFNDDYNNDGENSGDGFDSGFGGKSEYDGSSEGNGHQSSFNGGFTPGGSPSGYGDGPAANFGNSDRGSRDGDNGSNDYPRSSAQISGPKDFQNPRSTVFEDNKSYDDEQNIVEQTTGEDDSSETFVGGIPMNTIKELVNEAISAAEHHKRHMKSNQKHYGSGESVIWNDPQQQPVDSKFNQVEDDSNEDSQSTEYEGDASNRNPVVNHPVVKHVLREIENNPNFLNGAREVVAHPKTPIRIKPS
ncbi:hypothetical protein BLA29_007943, partial [Euroglyphus maynei]